MILGTWRRFRSKASEAMTPAEHRAVGARLMAHYVEVFFWLRKLGVAKKEAHDAVQDVFAAAFARWGDYSPDPADHALKVQICREGTSPLNWRTLVACAVEGVTLEALAEQEGVTKGAIEWRLEVARREMLAAIQRHRTREPMGTPRGKGRKGHHE
jgi:DNA-directed RNA polymerase specialized sigma24 family protein